MLVNELGRMQTIDATDDHEMQAEGKAQQTEGKGQQFKGEVKGKLGDDI